jgi:hypothetical protein
MTTATTTTTIDPAEAKLRAELACISARGKRRAAAAAKDEKWRFAILHQLEALSLRKLLNVPGGVQTRYRVATGKDSRLNDAPGTLTEIRRTRGTVLFMVDGQEQRWDFPLSDLKPATEPQGWEISLGGGR